MHFKDPLFVRGRGALVPTSRALAIEPIVLQMLGTLDGLLSKAPFDVKTVEREFVIMGSDYCENVLLPPLLSALREQTSGVTVRLTSITDGMSAQLEQEKIDCVILPEQRMQPTLQHRFLFADPYVCIAAKPHPQILNRLDLDVFCGLPHVQVIAKSGEVPCISPIDTILGKMNRRRRVMATVSTQFSVGRIVA